ncbi:dual specificity protein phosphatase 16-like [Sinocyclocheilus rhinocerous]|uniref:Dual specificity protein phosphatase 16-like n=1 Tax=Sinocyclocheilus rhinocerous TaxID=307959 RepID=A0A673KBK2_9TELE|nr:PREDICTED: dual specificity protein phosphatase 16-like [Sinocyclocheilus rhinocerous]XP_016367583.1 PREDICTED: dual specificity protein phosphatase 16-like [Sinocyclocheilus rhinocerous]
MCERAARPIEAEGLVALLEGGLDRVLLIDSRPFVEYNACHILEAVNVNCSKLMKRRLQQDKIQISELLQHSAKRKLELQGQEVVVYDQSSSDPASLSSEAFLSVLLAKLEKSFPSVHLLSGGFVAFSQLFPGLCEGKSTLVPSCISQPCLSVSSSGPTRILTHLYLGCQRDVLNQELMQQNDIAYVLNASNTCPKPDFIPDSHFLRVPVNDSFCEKILPWLDRSVEFIEKAKASNARVLVHCLAGISRSATIAIAYIMKRMDMSLDEAYRFVKEKRPTISPNFNFLGQLLDFEKKLKSTSAAPLKPRPPADEQKPEPLTMPCVLAGVPEEHLLARALCGLQLGEEPQENVRPKRSFSLDIKSYGESGASLRAFPVGEPCQFSPVQEVSEQSPAEDNNKTLQRSGSMDGAPSKTAKALKGWHSDIVLGPVTGGWFLSSESARFYGCAQGLEAVRRRGRQRSGDGGDSRRSWHEESSFEKQLKRRSCQIDGMTDSRSREEMGTRSSQSSFSGSLEIIEVS